ncbi:MAG: isocitrate/isopropylmalate dehydrogenase family protein [Elusimicrobia bacterium]|nr:isocitrate/isopropylmalate dehydrogenase family protein [Elusimicrobiota bacterium]
MAHRITLIPGDGTGPELAEVVRDVVEATEVPIEWEMAEAGEAALKKHGTLLPQKTLDSIRKNRVALKGPITTPIGTGFRSVNVALRRELDLYACVRPCKLYAQAPTPARRVDLVVVRENTEDLYAGVEFAPGSPEAKKIEEMADGKIAKNAAISIKPISEKATERLVRFAFEYAMQHKRRKVTVVTKANIMKCTDGLFLEVARQVAKKFEGRVEYEERLIDNMCMQLVLKPQFYDVLALPNLYGDILSDLCAGLIGGLGVAPGANFGTETALFEAVHGSAPKYVGLNKVNPTALILSAMLMLRHLGQVQASQRLEQAVAQVLSERRHLTYDLGGCATTREMGEAIIQKLKALATHEISS